MADNYGDTRQATSGDWLPSNVGGFGAQALGGAAWPPTVLGCYGYAWRQLWLNFWRLLVIGIVWAVVLYVPIGILGVLAQHSLLWRLLSYLYDILVVIPLG